MEVWQTSCRDGPRVSSLCGSSIWELRHASSPYNDFFLVFLQLTLAKRSNSTNPIPWNPPVLLVPEQAPAWPLIFPSQVSKTMHQNLGFPCLYFVI